MKKTIIDQQLLEHILPEGFIKDGYITTNNSPTEYSYEDYLRELINNSAWFMKKTNGEKFTKPSKESNAENDAQTSSYCIDFKLILGQSIQNVKSKVSSRIDQNTTGSRVAYRVARAPGEYYAFWLHRVLRQLTTDDLKRIWNDKPDKPEEQDVLAFLKSIKKDKNLLLFYPVVFECDAAECFDVSSINEAMQHDYGKALELRTVWYPWRETYTAFLYNKSLHIALYTEGKLCKVDSIDLASSPTFKWLCDFYWLDPTIKLLTLT